MQRRQSRARSAGATGPADRAARPGRWLLALWFFGSWLLRIRPARCRAASSENSLLKSTSDCGAVVERLRTGQLALASGRSKASKIGYRRLRRAKT